MSAGRRFEPRDTSAVWHDFHRGLLRFISRRVQDRDSAEDILQEVMLRIYRHIGELEHTPAIGAWVFQIARNAITDHYRRASARRERPVGTEVEQEEALLSEPADLRSELTACLDPLLERLPAIYREALELTELEGLTQAGAAKRLGLSASGMKSRVQRARAQLKALFVDCCEIELDRRGGVMSYEPRPGRCECRGGGRRPPPADRPIPTTLG